MHPGSDLTPAPQAMVRRLGLRDAVVVGMSAMIGAGIFSAFAPAAAAAGSGLLIGLAIAAVVAYCNATSSARLAARYPTSGGTYVYARHRLGELWAGQAGWAFIVGKTASCAAMALTVGSYVAPGHARPVAVLAVVALTALGWAGVQRSTQLSTVIVVVSLAALAVVVLASFRGGTADPTNLQPFPGSDAVGILQSAGLLFFAFAGYARVATLGEEVRDPTRTIPRAISIALLVVLVVYGVVGLSALLAIGAHGLAATPAPLQAVVEAGSWAAWSPAVQVGAATASLGALLALLLGVSRTVVAVARDRPPIARLARLHARTRTPRTAEVTIGIVVVALVSTLDLRGAIGFSSFGVLVYYAIANASALTLSRDEGRPPRLIPVVGLVGCLVLACTLPLGAVLAGLVVVLLATLEWAVGRRR
ncbi:APC family permease [Cellulomonas sp. URHD0024]|uniref:APC family permease n=1 Tax=Cellulomonas sp. URHD0024 TaxID=1302620 RepID=UPI0004041180